MEIITIQHAYYMHNFSDTYRQNWDLTKKEKEESKMGYVRISFVLFNQLFVLYSIKTNWVESDF